MQHDVNQRRIPENTPEESTGKDARTLEGKKGDPGSLIFIEHSYKIFR